MGLAIEKRGEVTWLRLQSPERMNAYDADDAKALEAALNDSAETRVFVITGSGRAFCAGGMLTNFETPTVEDMRGLYRASLALFDAIRLSPRPVIAAVNGAAAGGGNELVIACDLAIAGQSATFGQTGPKVGSSPVLGGTNVMGVQIGEKRAKELAMLCRRYSADRALEMGLINEVVEDDALEDRVTEWCEEICQLSPRYLEITKQSSNLWWNSARDSFVTGLGMLVQAVGSPDMVEGASAFLEKRPPEFPFPG